MSHLPPPPRASIGHRAAALAGRLLAIPALPMTLLSLVIGLAAGAGVWLFKQAITLFQWGFSTLWVNPLAVLDPLPRILVPVLGGLLVAALAQRFWAHEKLHGTASIIQAVALSGGRLPYRIAPLKALAAALSIGAGASVGPEDPSVQIGANLGSWVGQRLHLSEDRTRTLVAAGAAAAIAAAFNAPIAGVFFALEIILGELGTMALGMILTAAVMAAVLTQALVGSMPAFMIPAYTLNSVWELPLYLILGLLAGLLAATYGRLLYALHDLVAAWSAPRWLKMALTGLVIGGVGLFLPQLLGVGYETIGAVLQQQALPLRVVLLLLIGKVILTPLSLAGGFVGGVFAPALFIGAMLGDAFGILATLLWPNLGINPAAFALVGMAAVLAGAVHAPLTAILLLFEMTHDYRIILPLRFAVAVSLLISQHLQPQSVYALGLSRLGIRLERGRAVDVLATLTVGEVMQPNRQALTEDMPLDTAAEILAHTRRHGMPVVNSQGWLVGMFTLADLDRGLERGLKTVGEACTRRLITVTPTDTLAEAMRRMSMGDLGRLPVVDPANPRQLVGILRRSDAIRAYEIALTRRVAQAQRQAAARLDAFTPATVRVHEVTIAPGAAAEGKPLRDIPFPPGCLVASVRRGDQIEVPNGETRLQAGDVLTLVAEDAVLPKALAICQAPPPVEPA